MQLLKMEIIYDFWEEEEVGTQKCWEEEWKMKWIKYTYKNKFKIFKNMLPFYFWVVYSGIDTTAFILRYINRL